MDTIHGTTRKDGYTPVKNVDYFDGQPGQNGKSAYLWIRYSQNADGSGMTTDPANAKYTGYATTETNVAPTSQAFISGNKRKAILVLVFPENQDQTERRRICISNIRMMAD